MKATLEFDLPEDYTDHLIAVHALDWALTCFDMDDKLRSWLKYGNEFKSPDEALEVVRDCLFEIMEMRNISLEMIP